MDRNTVFTKTAKGITQVNQKSASLSKDLMKVLKLIDGKSNFGQLMEKADFDKVALEKALNTLTKDGYARVFQVRQEEADPFAGEDDFDFTAPGKMPAATQRVVPGAANDISELVRQQEKADAERKSREQAHEQARVRAKAEAENRAKLEAEAKAKAQAEQQAMEQARRAKEAADRAKAELDAKRREEEARNKALAEQQARLTADQKVKEEAESRRIAEMREKAEKEARALAEARARAEAEAQALARARAEAEAAAKKQAQEATSAEKQLKERLKEEIESRIRSEMEDLLRNELEEKTRNEMRAQILEEARLAARAELEERLREEREALAHAEMEARAKAEADARARAEREAKLRAEAEARAASEAEARHRAEEEARRHAHAAQRAREEADARAKEQQEAEQRLEAERRAKYEAEARARIEAEERERREAELQASLDEERKAKQEAEARARIEARARETIAEDTRVKVQAELEADLEKRAKIEGKAQAKAYMEAKARAEVEEEEKMRAEQARKAKEIADILRTKVEPDDLAPEAPARRRRRARRRGGAAKTVFFFLGLFLLVGIIALHIVPLRPYAAKLERTMSAWLHDDVSIGAVTFRLFPTPHLNLEDLSVGKVLDAKAATGRIYLDITTLFGEHPSIDRLELDNVTIASDAVRRIPVWGSPEGKSKAGISEIVLHGVKLDVKPALDPFNADLRFARDGNLAVANLRAASGQWDASLKPMDKKGYSFTFDANNWTPPLGAPILIADATLVGTIDGSQLVVPEFKAHILEGDVNGTLQVGWGSGVHLASNLSVARMEVKHLIEAFTPDIALTGRLDGNFDVASDSPSLESLLDAPRVQGRFKVSEGSVSNVDLVAVMQSDSAGQRAGVTKFAELEGDYGAADKRATYSQLQLQGGVLRGSGAVDLAPNGGLSGHLALEIRSQVAQDRGAFSVSGTVARPIIKRGG
ncbi:MAG TPA: hypothetical protein VLY46_12615 [Usitatibacter sp.]|nr:hypothetical protein [Usitatibacter sp.]